MMTREICGSDVGYSFSIDADKLKETQSMQTNSCVMRPTFRLSRLSCEGRMGAMKICLIFKNLAAGRNQKNCTEFRESEFKLSASQSGKLPCTVIGLSQLDTV